ncbi:phosphate transporter [Bacteroidia bacterium]|nr:phosphate transporter [Bacteroidia bacterium]
MDHFFIIVLVFLGLLAVFDLFVGVSNDAVNFLNSAIGSRVASFRVVMMVASLGVLIGATFSSGMMEIARSGVFHPEMFSFREIMIIFFGVMITDVLLLDIFNSLGLPTSTTVSIVFELLGGAVAAAAYKLWNSNAAGHVSDYINNEKALAIISGILISVVVAFIAGLVIQYLCRLIFTFRYQKTYKYWGAVFGGIALTAIIYFLVMKGAKGSSFMRPEYVAWIEQHTLSILFYTFLSLTALFELLIYLFKANILKVVILAGTFALAFAFAGNDLVNFVGVPIAALDSYMNFTSSGGGNSDLFMMEGLRKSIPTPTGLLLLAGAIMVFTLWVSKKARRVIETSINLSSSSRGAKEQFGSSLFGRTIVRGSIKFGKAMHQILPGSLFGFLDRRMEIPPHKKGEVVLPFDHIRASINLVVSAILIALATSLKLPLSTTYVTFMVAMGSSLADGAWDRESAVYRVSGVMTVIGGWFTTALCAFTLCLAVTMLILWGGNWAAIALMALVTLVVVKSNLLPGKKNATKEEFGDAVDKVAICSNVNSAVSSYHKAIIALYEKTLNDFESENRRQLRKDKSEALGLYEEVTRRRAEYYRLAINGSADPDNKVERDARHYYYRVFTNLKEICHSLRGVVGTTHNHVDNNHHVFEGQLRENLFAMIDDLKSLRRFINEFVTDPSNDDTRLTERAQQSIDRINDMQLQLLSNIDSEQLSLRRSELYLNFLLFSRDIVNRFMLIALLQHELNEKCGLTPEKTD